MISQQNIPFHIPTFIGKETAHIEKIIREGSWTKESEESRQFFKNYYPGSSCFFTNSCSSALEIAIRALGIGQGDEVIIPGFGYVAVANAVVNNGAKPVFADIESTNGNIDAKSVQSCISPRTKAVIGIHYAGSPFNIFELTELCKNHNISLIEDAAQSICSSYGNRPLGSFGDIACLSFDYMKNISCGQGGLIIVNNKNLIKNVQVIYDNGTDKDCLKYDTNASYEWVGNGSNCQINPLASHFLYVQLMAADQITADRKKKWERYFQLLSPLRQSERVILPDPESTHNGHIFYIIVRSEEERMELRSYLRARGIFCEHHYSSLAQSSYGKKFSLPHITLKNSKKFCRQLLRLPIHQLISEKDIDTVVASVSMFYNK